MQLENRTFDDLRIGDSESIQRLCTTDDLLAFANVSGNHNPMHIFDADGDGDGHPEAVVPGMFVGALITAVLGNVLPGIGTLYRSQNFVFHGRAHAGDELISRVTVTGKNEKDGTVTLATEVTRVADQGPDPVRRGRGGSPPSQAQLQQPRLARAHRAAAPAF